MNLADAMEVVHGPGHMEVKYTTTGPCLVEVGTRCHGGEGTWQAIAEECLGYNQVPPARVARKSVIPSLAFSRLPLRRSTRGLSPTGKVVAVLPPAHGPPPFFFFFSVDFRCHAAVRCLVFCFFAVNFRLMTP